VAVRIRATLLIAQKNDPDSCPYPNIVCLRGLRRDSFENQKEGCFVLGLLRSTSSPLHVQRRWPIGASGE
jgi:hypothetical protein